MFILDARLRKDDIPPPVMPDPDRASRAKDSLFWRGVNAPIKAVLFFPDPRFRKDDGRRGVAGGGFLLRAGVSLIPKKRN